MSELPETNQERPQGSWEQDQGVDQSRRKLAKIGAAAPVIMTLASKPVFGAQCLSQMMSGNASVDVTGSCALGTSPGGLSKLQGSTVVPGVSVVAAWVKAGLTYAVEFQPATQYYDAFEDATYDDTNSQEGYHSLRLKKPGNMNKTEDYIGGTLVSELPFETLYSHSKDTPIRLVLDNSNGYKDKELRHVLAAYINAHVDTNYALTPDQVVGLYEGTIPIPGGLSLTDLLAATW
jgi:hypothetical protein